MTLNTVQNVADVYYTDTGSFENNGHVATYIVDGEESIVVDPGFSTSLDRLTDTLAALGIDDAGLDYIAVTHVHLDHAGAVGYLAEEYPEATVLCHEAGVDFLTDEAKLERLLSGVKKAVGELADQYGTATPVPRDRVRVLTDGETVAFEDRTFEVLHATGHAPHQMCLYDRTNKALFVADECGEFPDGDLYPTTPPPDFDLAANLRSLERFRELEIETLLYPHYGPKSDPQSTFDDYAERLQAWVAEVESSWETHQDESAVVDAFIDSEHPKYEVWEPETAREVIRMDVTGALRYVKSTR